MAAAGYMTEADVESIWEAGDIDTTRFGKVNVRMGEMLNFMITGDAATDITDTKILPILEQLSEEGLLRLFMASKANSLHDPWDFIVANVSSVMSQIITENREIINMIKNNIYGSFEMVTRDLPQSERSY